MENKHVDAFHIITSLGGSLNLESELKKIAKAWMSIFVIHIAQVHQ